MGHYLVSYPHPLPSATFQRFSPAIFDLPRMCSSKNLGIRSLRLWKFPPWFPWENPACAPATYMTLRAPRRRWGSSEQRSRVAVKTKRCILFPPVTQRALEVTLYSSFPASKDVMDLFELFGMLGWGPLLLRAAAFFSPRPFCCCIRPNRFKVLPFVVARDRFWFGGPFVVQNCPPVGQFHSFLLSFPPRAGGRPPTLEDLPFLQHDVCQKCPRFLALD